MKRFNDLQNNADEPDWINSYSCQDFQEESQVNFSAGFSKELLPGHLILQILVKQDSK